MKTNRLSHEKSPYLLQHQHNPVDWFPWGEEAFEKARREQKPIFLSIGYSTCHWCHVMEHESFENDAIAALLNESYVSIKVDREERPDVDRVYMTFVQATTGSGGWPMTVFLTPDLKPFVGGTYFPPEDRWGRPGFPTLLKRLATAWRDDRPRLLAQGDEVIEALREYTTSAAPAGEAPDFATMQFGYAQIAPGFDPVHGGFSHAPKFPRPSLFNFLFHYSQHRPGMPESTTALEMPLLTLRKMADGGIYDHLGGGFHRYSVDTFWHIPHFEKMLYDQGQLACSYLDAYQITRDPAFANVARGILDYVTTTMTSKEGGFFSAEDADSPLPEDPTKRGEGAFFTWTQAEIESLLPAKDGEIFKRAYGVEPNGNAPDGSDPHHELTGKNTLIRRASNEELAGDFGKAIEEIEASLATSRRILFAQRETRPRPHLDDKIITAWNGLMISGFARAALTLNEPTYLLTAERATTFIKEHLFIDGQLLRSYREGASTVTGFADDYAFLIQGLLDLYEANGKIDWLQWALELQQIQDRLFLDASLGGYFSTTGTDPSVLLRIKEDHDGAEPSANSVAALNALRLGRMLDDGRLIERGQETIRAFSTQLEQSPHALPQMLVALDFAISKPMQVVLAGEPATSAPLAHELFTHFIPNKVVLHADGGTGQNWLSERLEFLRTINAGKAAAYVCENFACQTPAFTTEEVRSRLTHSQERQ